MSANNDEHFMKLAYAEAQLALEKDEVPIGAVVVLKGAVIGRGHNLTQTLNDVTAHAEMQALTAASGYLGAKYLNECTLYVTLEPCIMCAGAIAWSQLGTLVYAADDPKKGYTTLQKSILHPKTVVRTGVMKDECGKLLTDFFAKKRF